MIDGRVDDWARTFRVDPRRDVAIARVHGRTVVGRAVTLDASRSLIVPRVRQARGVRWVLLRRPRRSHVRLGRPHGARITLRPDVPGYYVVGLRVGCTSHSAAVAAAGSGAPGGYDVATVAAKYAEPLVPLNTMAPGSGVTVGKDFYARQGTGQLVVLRRSTLELLDYRSFNESDFNPYAGEQRPFVHSPMYDYVASLPTTDLVIFTWQGGLTNYNGNTLVSFRSTLNLIGGSAPAKSRLSTPNCWSGATDQCANGSWQTDYSFPSFSVIGVPGMQVGQAWRETAAQAGGQAGRIAGYLTQGSDQSTAPGSYTVVNGGADQYEAVNTCAPPDCAVQVGYPGDAHYATYPSPGANGFQVLELDRTTLAPLLNRTVTTQADLLSALSYAGGQQQVGQFVSSMDDQRLVIIRSVGNGLVEGRSGGGPTSPSPLFQYVDELGGTPDLLADAMTGGYKYALVGAATNLPWRNSAALESSTEIPGTPPNNKDPAGGPSAQTGRISGVVQRDRTGLYAPAAGSPSSQTNPDLYRILYEPAQPWPYADDTEDLKSIAYQLGLTNQSGTTGWPDIRSAYYENLNGESWSNLESRLSQKSQVVCPHPVGECDTFDNLRKELQDEFGWVGQVQIFGTNLISPYTGENSLDIKTVYLDVKASVPVPTAQKVKFDWFGLMDGLTYLGSSIASLRGAEGLSGYLGLLGSAGTLATWVMGTVNQPNGNGAPAPADTLTDTADNLTQELLNQVAAYETWVGEMQGIVVYDYGKLRQVGIATAGDDAWKVGANARSTAVDALRGSTRAEAYSALIPAVWPAYNLKGYPYPGNQPYSANTANFACDSASTGKNTHQYPFGHATQANQLSWIPRPPIPTTTRQAVTTQNPDGGVVNQAWVFAQLNPAEWADHGGGVRGGTLPNTDLTHYIYGADSTTGDHGAYQFAPVWWRNTYNPPSHTLCWRLPDGSSSQNFYSTQYPPPNIPLPAP
jgi:hypothetical protein